jgi:hypothetical protein
MGCQQSKNLTTESESNMRSSITVEPESIMTQEDEQDFKQKMT